MAGPEPINDDAAAFALGACGPFGKYSHGEVKTHLDEATYNGWLRLCAERDVKSSELLRDAVYRLVHGKSPSEMVSDHRAGILDRLGPNVGLAGGGS